MRHDLTPELFEGRVGETFVLDLGGESRDLVLKETTVGTAAESGRGPKALSLVFRSTDDAYVPQRIYRLTHEEVGEIELFLVPIGPDGDGRMCLEAVLA